MNQEESKQNEVNGMKKGAFRCASPDAYLKQRLQICNEDDADGRDGRESRRVAGSTRRLNRDQIL